MRTTMDIDDDVLMAVKELATVRGQTAGQVLSSLARKGLDGPKKAAKVRNGVPILPARPAGSPPLTMALVNQLRDDE